MKVWDEPERVRARDASLWRRIDIHTGFFNTLLEYSIYWLPPPALFIFLSPELIISQVEHCGSRTIKIQSPHHGSHLPLCPWLRKWGNLAHRLAGFFISFPNGPGGPWMNYLGKRRRNSQSVSTGRRRKRRLDREKKGNEERLELGKLRKFFVRLVHWNHFRQIHL